MFELWKSLIEWVEVFFPEHERIIRFVSYIVSPLVTLYAFWSNRQERKEIVNQTAESTTQRIKAEEALTQLDKTRRELDVKSAEADRLRKDLEVSPRHKRRYGV